MSGWSRPGSGGRNGEDPGHSASLSHVSVYSSPVIRSRAVTVSGDRVDRGHLGGDPDVDVQGLAQALRGLQEQA